MQQDRNDSPTIPADVANPSHASAVDRPAPWDESAEISPAPAAPAGGSRGSARATRNPYRAILRVPGARAFCVAAGVARSPMSMVGIGSILMVRLLYGNYSMAGQVAAVLCVATAFGGPLLARLVDRLGQRRVMAPALATASVGLSGLIWAADAHAPAWVLFAFAALTGATSGSYGSLVRARWTHAVGAEPRKLHTAFSLEGAIDELIFVVGPVAATLLATRVFPTAGLVVALGLGLIGGIWFLSLRHTEPPLVRARPGVAHRSAITAPGMPILVLGFVGMGAIFGSNDISIVAFADENGHKDAAGLILAMFALGSLVSGLAYGLRHWLAPLWKQYALGMVCLAVGVSLLLFVQSFAALAVVGFVAGFAIAPSIIAGNGLVQSLVPAGQLTEGLTWVGTALNIGVSIGSWIAGVRVDAGGSHAGFVVLVCAAGFAVLVTLGSLSTLRRRAVATDAAS